MRNERRCRTNTIGDEGQGLQNEAAADDHPRQTAQWVQNKLSGFQTINTIVCATIISVPFCPSSPSFSCYRALDNNHVHLLLRCPTTFRKHQSGFSAFSYHWLLAITVLEKMMSVLKDYRNRGKIDDGTGLLLSERFCSAALIVWLAFRQISKMLAVCNQYRKVLVRLPVWPRSFDLPEK
jgi:hypothetical protein